MNFSEALELMKQGKWVRRKWGNSDLLITIAGVSFIDNDRDFFSIDAEDAMGEDWELYEEQPKIREGLSFAEAMCALAHGREIKREKYKWVSIAGGGIALSTEDIGAYDWMVKE